LPRWISRATLSVIAAALVVFPATAGASMLTSPTSVGFGSQPVGTVSESQNVNLIAHCDGSVVPGICTIPVIFTPAPSTTGDFSQTTNCPALITVVVDADSICGILVKFTPTAAGARTGTLSTGLGGPSVALSGAGVTPSGPRSGGGTTTTQKKQCKKKHKHRSASSAKKRKCKRHK
jgi:hypothetical protein